MKKTYIVPLTQQEAPFDLGNLLCDSKLDDENGIPDLTEDVFEW